MAEGGRAQEHESIFSDGEVIVIGVCLGALDILDLIQFGTPIGDVLSWGLQAYQYKKGTSGGLQLIVGGLEIIPGADYLPIRTAGFGLLVWGDRHPDSKLAKLIKVAEVASALKGKVKGKTGKSGLGAGAQEATEAPAGSPFTAANDNGLAISGGEATGASLENGDGSSAPGSSESSVGGGKAKRTAQETGEETGQEGTDGGDGSRRGLAGEIEDDNEEGGEQEKDRLSPAERHGQRMMEGKYIEDLEDKSFSPDQIYENIGSPELGASSSKLYPTKMGPEMNPKPTNIPRPANDNLKKGIINQAPANDNAEQGEQVDLRGKKSR